VSGQTLTTNRHIRSIADIVVDLKSDRLLPQRTRKPTTTSSTRWISPKSKKSPAASANRRARSQRPPRPPSASRQRKKKAIFSLFLQIFSHFFFSFSLHSVPLRLALCVSKKTHETCACFTLAHCACRCPRTRCASLCSFNGACAAAACASGLAACCAEQRWC
jgi:hypothetical protein